MKIAVAQISCSLGDPEANLSKVRDFSRQAKETGAELIVFPEMTDTGYSMPVIRTHAASWTSGFVPGIQEIATKLSIAIVSGVSERDGSSIYNSQVLVDAAGVQGALGVSGVGLARHQVLADAVGVGDGLRRRRLAGTVRRAGRPE